MQYNKKMFIIEDEQNVRNAIKRLIKKSLPSVGVVETGDGNLAVSVAKNYKPNLILLDVLMPNINGLQVLKSLKESEDEEVRKIPVIMLTGVGNKEIITEAKKMGAVDYITKPYNKKVFLLKVRKYLI